MITSITFFFFILKTIALKGAVMACSEIDELTSRISEIVPAGKILVRKKYSLRDLNETSKSCV